MALHVIAFTKGFDVAAPVSIETSLAVTLCPST
jgi:hypothetical protein